MERCKICWAELQQGEFESGLCERCYRMDKLFDTFAKEDSVEAVGWLVNKLEKLYPEVLK